MTTIVRRRKLGLTSVKGITEASTQGITYCNNYDPAGISPDEVYIRWGCTSTLPPAARTVINSAKSIHRVSDKSGFREELEQEGLCPRTWWDSAHVQEEDFPVIVRTKAHAQGLGLWFCKNKAYLEAVCRQAGAGHYINEFIPKVAEFRVFVLQGRVVWVAEKTPSDPTDIAWNVAKGGRFDNVRWGDWNMNVVNNALEVWELTRAHFVGIDVMLDEDGKAYCVEANSAPSQTSPYRQCCVAKAFDYMIQNEQYDRRIFEPIIARRWRDAIHPALLKGE